MRLLPAVLAASLALPLAGFEFDDSSCAVDMRLGAGIIPVAKNRQAMARPLPNGVADDSTDFTDSDHVPAYSLGLVGGGRSPVALALGIEFVHANGVQKGKSRNQGGAIQQADGAPGLQWRSNGGDLLAGIRFGGENIHGELLGFAGGGRTRFETWDPTMTATVGVSGWLTQIGYRVGIYYTFQRLQLGLAGDWGAYEIHDAAGASDVVELVYGRTKWSGYGGRFEIGYRLQ